MSPVKEPDYFAAEIRKEHISAAQTERRARLAATGPAIQDFGGLIADGDEYQGLCQGVSREKAIGEASVCYR